MKTADIDDLARLLDGDPATNGEASAEARALTSLARAMESRAAAAPRPEFRDELRATLLAEALKPVPPSLLERARYALDERIARLRYSAKVATATGMAALTLSTGGVAAATTLSVPGDLFYPVKLTVDDMRLARADAPAERAAVLLSITEERIAEAERAADADRQDSAADALVAADAALRDAAAVLIGAYQETGDRTVLAALEELGSSSHERLAALADHLSGDALRALEHLQVAFARVDARIAAVTGACCGGSTGARPGIPAAEGPFDFGRIPPADEPFEACPCPGGEQPGTTTRPSTTTPPSTSTPTQAPTSSPGRSAPPSDGTTRPPDSSPEPTNRPSTSGPIDGVAPPDDVVPTPLDGPLDDVVDPLKDVLDDVIDQVPADEVTKPLKPVTDPLKDVTDPLKGVTDPVTDPLRDVTDPLTDPLEDITDPLDLPGIGD